MRKSLTLIEWWNDLSGTPRFFSGMIEAAWQNIKVIFKDSNWRKESQVSFEKQQRVNQA